MEETVPDLTKLRALARRCSDSLTTAVRPEVREQLRLWFREIADQAEEAARHSPHRNGAAEHQPWGADRQTSSRREKC
jgi:hypothetical protein